MVDVWVHVTVWCMLQPMVKVMTVDKTLVTEDPLGKGKARHMAMWHMTMLLMVEGVVEGLKEASHPGRRLSGRRRLRAGQPSDGPSLHSAAHPIYAVSKWCTSPQRRAAHQDKPLLHS